MVPFLGRGRRRVVDVAVDRLFSCKQQEKEQAGLAAWRLIEPQMTKQKCIASRARAIPEAMALNFDDAEAMQHPQGWRDPPVRRNRGSI
jgi:hypothetical protein